MVYRIDLKLAFTTLDPLDDILDKVKDHFAQAVTINPGQPNEEKGFYTYQHCHHDEDPTAQCPIIEHQETP